MQPTTSNQADLAKRLIPLVRSIGRELAERLSAVHVLETRMLSLARKDGRSPAFRLAMAEAATHYRCIRQGRTELDRIGCSVIGEHPLTVRIPSHEGEKPASVFWQASEPSRAPRL